MAALRTRSSRLASSALSALSALTALSALSACDADLLEAASGRYVNLYWDPDQYRLCGGTIEHIDRSLEVIAETYALPLPKRPSIEVFWLEPEGVETRCNHGSPGCVYSRRNGTSIMLVSDPLHRHEIAHAVRFSDGSRNLPSFFLEGIAGRWEPGLSDHEVGKADYVGALDYASTLALIEQDMLEGEAYPEAGFFWTWLEAEYGPEALARFAADLPPKPSTAEVEASFEAALGVSLSDAIDSSRGQPMPMFDMIPCSLPELETLSWDDAGLSFGGEERSCADAAVINIGVGAVRFLRLELPEDWQQYELVTTQTGLRSVWLTRCAGPGIARPYEQPLEYSGDTSGTVSMGGDHVVALTAPIADDGSVSFPRVELSAP